MLSFEGCRPRLLLLLREGCGQPPRLQQTWTTIGADTDDYYCNYYNYYGDYYY